MSRMSKLYPRTILDIAHKYAISTSGCLKVQVGAAIVKNNSIVSLGANRAFPDLCTVSGCRRIELYGTDSKNHRLPADCRAIHSEVDAICSCHTDTHGCVMYVTRYPCEACARAICAAGITKVLYGREQVISEETQKIFEESNIECFRVDWNAEDTER